MPKRWIADNLASQQPEAKIRGDRFGGLRIVHRRSFVKREWKGHKMVREPGRESRSILVVDDEPLVSMYLVDFFLDEGFQVFEAQSADQAIAILDANSAIGTVVTDVQMPGSMDGLRLAHFIRDRWPPTVLIVVSGAAPVNVDYLPSSASFFAKPVDPRTILKEIERLHA